MPSVSRLVAELDGDLRVRLTEEGAAVFLERAAVLGDELEGVTGEVRTHQNVPRGRLRISSVMVFGQERLVPSLPLFRTRHPEVTAERDLTNRFVDQIEEGIDLVF